jgi:hypothetical protein
MTRNDLRQIRQEIQSGVLSSRSKHLLLSLVDNGLARTTALQEASERRHRDITERIHRAADEILSEPIRTIYPSKKWTSLLHRALHRKYEAFGLHRVPCKRVIRRALREWTPSHESALKKFYA